MFEKHHAKKAQEHYEAQLAQWQEKRDQCADLVQLAQTYTGTDSDAIMLKPGEAVFATVHNAGLIEDRRGAGHWEGHSTGVSLPMGSLGEHQMRYRIGATRGHYVQASPEPTAIDTGEFYVTNQRVSFQGARQTRECLFSKLVGVQHAADGGSTIFSVSNRQKPTVVHYGTELAAWFQFRLDLALAHFRGTVPEVIAAAQQQLAQVDGLKPVPPAPLG